MTKENGQTIAWADFDAWEKPRSPVDFDMNMAGVDNAVSFTSYTYDVVLDLYFAQARFYDANSRRFTQVDPIKDGINWYAYCGNNPIVFVDPSGLTEVGLRAYAESYGASVSWDAKTGKATVSYHGITKSYAERTNEEGRMVIDDSVLNNTFGFSTNPISIVKDGDITVISAVVSISGAGADDTIGTSSTAYRQVAVNGIINNWRGSDVRVYVIDLEDGKPHTVPTGQKSLPITINQGLGISHVPGGAWKSYSDPGEIMLYQGDSRRNGDLYTAKNMGWVAAHVFGHAMGVGDAYTVIGRGDIPSIMNKFGTPAQRIDIDMVWRAYNSNTWQSWPQMLPDYGPMFLRNAAPYC